MAGDKSTLFNVAVHEVPIAGETYSLKEMSAKDYLAFNDFQKEIDEDESINERSKNFYRAALMGVFSLVDGKGSPMFEPGEYKTLVENMKADKLMTLSVEVMRINGMSETEEDAAKNS